MLSLYIGAARYDFRRISTLNISHRRRLTPPIMDLVAGNLRLASNNPLAKPIIWGNYLSDPMDVAILVEGIEVALSLANTSAMVNYNMTLSNQPLSPCSGFPFLSKEYWSCAVRQDTGPENHQAGSCKMGPPSDPMAVVDHQLRVYGIRNLRVADASIMPQVSVVIARNTTSALSIFRLFR